MLSFFPNQENVILRDWQITSDLQAAARHGGDGHGKIDLKGNWPQK